MKASISRNIYVARKDYQESIDAVQSDSGRQIIFAIVDMEIPSGSTARVYALKPDNTEVFNNCTVSGQLITVNMTTQMLAAVGIAKFQVQITNSSDIVTTFEFALNVRKSLVSSSAIQSTNEFTALQSALATATGLQSSIDSLNDSLDNLFPGGTNILRNTNTSTALTSSSAWSAGTWNAYNTNGTTAIVQYTAGDAPNPDITFGHRVTLTGTACSYSQRDVPLLSGQEYTMSAYVRLISGEGNLLLRAQGTANQTKRFVATSDWAKVTFTFTADGSAHIIFLNDTAVGVIDFCGEKLELGNKATDWCLSPWDITNRLTKAEAAIVALGGTI